MPKVIIVRLVPLNPTSGAVFSNYLSNLSIQAFDHSFNSPAGVLVGQAQGAWIPNTGPAPVSPPFNPATQRIIQNFTEVQVLSIPGSPPEIRKEAVGTAIIELIPPAGHPEFDSTDLRLEIKQNGLTVLHEQLDFNVKVETFNPLSSNPKTYINTDPPGVYVSLPDPAVTIDPLSAFVELPADGSAPKFVPLRDAINKVLAQDPAGGATLANRSPLTVPQARQVAREIIWNRRIKPAPDRPNNRKLEDMYTRPETAHPGWSNDDRQKADMDREQFEASFLGYYALQNANSERLTQYVFAASAALWAEMKSEKPKRVGLRFPVETGAPLSGATLKQAEIVVTDSGAFTLNFTVPAEYFYALSGMLATSVTAEQRYQMAIQEGESRLTSGMQTAIDSGIIVAPATKPENAARRLVAIGRGNAVHPALCSLNADLKALVDGWLADLAPSIDPFWQQNPFPHAAGHLDLVLAAVTRQTEVTADSTALISKIKAIPVTNVNQLKVRTVQQWHAFFLPGNANLLPTFTNPGTPSERVDAFVRQLRKFFEVLSVAPAPGASVVSPLPAIPIAATDPLGAFVAAFPGFAFPVGNWADPAIATALQTVFPGDTQAQAWLLQALRTIDELLLATNGAGSADLQFSLMEALYARGFTSRASIQALSLGEFEQALTGTIAFPWAAVIQNVAGGSVNVPEPPASGLFMPVNADGSLINCIPPWHLSPLGPVMYLHDLLATGAGATCEHPVALGQTLLSLITPRRGDLGMLHATAANVHTFIPLIDMVNESLENLADNGTSGIVYNTNPLTLGGHILQPADAPDGKGHNPAKLFAALPEHSSPATPVKKPGAYTKLAEDFTSPKLPYSQPLDISRSYLSAMGSSRFDVMRTFRKDITEFAIDAGKEAIDFQKHLWRYPVRIETAIEYLRLSPHEYEKLYVNDIASELELSTLYGFPPEFSKIKDWKTVVIHVPEFLKRTGLDYCEFLELWESRFVEFERVPARPDSTNPDARGDRDFPRCEPCCPEDLIIHFLKPVDVGEALKKLAVFIRLWRTLRCLPGAVYSFADLRDICHVLQLFHGAQINPGFIRQLVAFQILRDDWTLSLGVNPDAPVGAIGADRSRLLGIRIGPGSPSFDWAVDHLLEKLEDRAEREYALGRRPGNHRRHRSPEFLKLLRANLDPLSELAGFNLAAPNSWRHSPTCTLRFTEVMAKLYASHFTTGELLYLFSPDWNLNGDDPFPQQDLNEALDQPFNFPEDEHPFNLWVLRKKLLEVKVSEEDIASLNWNSIAGSLRADFGYDPAGSSDPLQDLGEHFFPEMMAHLGLMSGAHAHQYRTALPVTTAGVWNLPVDGVFQYDSVKKELVVSLPLRDQDVLSKLNSIDQLSVAEQSAVQQLHFSPRAELARFAFLFQDFGGAERALIEEGDEAKRWEYFRKSFAEFSRRSRITAEHLAAHVGYVADEPVGEPDLAWIILRRLLADENQASTPWEQNDGKLPVNFLWTQPAGGAFAALHGLAGTGLLGEFASKSGNSWHEVRGPMVAFSAAGNDWNAPVPTVIPNMNLNIPLVDLKFAILRNGLAIEESNGRPLAGAEGFTVRWTGVLIVEESGTYTFYAGAPTPGCEPPDFEACGHNRWRINLQRGQKTWLLLNHRWSGEQAPDRISGPLNLKRGAYFFEIDFEECPPVFDEKLELARATTGFTVKYAGPDTNSCIEAIPVQRLYRDVKQDAFPRMKNLSPAAQACLSLHYTSSIRDIRRTYQRAFKALMFCHRLHLSSCMLARVSVSEIKYMLTHPDLFAGTTYVPGEPFYTSHKADFDFNFLPVGDRYNGDPGRVPAPSLDQRATPSLARRQALFDWFERLYDYTVMRSEASKHSNRHAWLTFAEASNQEPADPTALLLDLGIDLDHAPVLLSFSPGVTVDWSMLQDERWAIRVWRGGLWVRHLLKHFVPFDLSHAEPEVWAGNTAMALASGNSNLTEFYRNGMIENGSPLRYADIEKLNNGLRERARNALLAYLCGMDRVPLPWAAGKFAKSPKDLSALLLLDVEAGICRQASRIEEAIFAVQSFVERSRLGFEPTFPIIATFAALWDKQFSTFNIWQTCRHRHIYSENFIEWIEHERAIRTEAFHFLESELRRSTFTAPDPGGMEWWPGSGWPDHPALIRSQHREPSSLKQVSQPENLGLMGRPERHARTTWLSPSQRTIPGGRQPDPSDNPNDPIRIHSRATTSAVSATHLPLWIQAAVRLGVRFLRIAAAGEPPATSGFAPHDGLPALCCSQCGKVHPPVMDEYYFWLVDSRFFDPAVLNPNDAALYQDADWGVKPPDSTSDWHRAERLPQLLQWPESKMVRLAWCRVHNGEFQTPRCSDDGAHVNPNGVAQLEFLGRVGDSLRFRITNSALVPVGYLDTSAWGFRYDMATDTAVVLPEALATPSASPGPAGLDAYPFFVYFAPGAPLEPSVFSTSMTVASAMRTRCRFEAALKWYELSITPHNSDLRWSTCRDPRTPSDDPRTPSDNPRTPSDNPRTPSDNPNTQRPPRVEREANAPGNTQPSAGPARGLRKRAGVPVQPADTNRSVDDSSAINIRAREPWNPCCNTLVRNEHEARRRSTLLAYLETLLQHGEAAMCGNSPEAFALARLRFDTVAQFLGQRPRTIFGQDVSTNPQNVVTFVPRFAPLNPRLMQLYDRLEDRLGMLHHCMNLARITGDARHLEASYWGNSPVSRSGLATASSCLDDDGCCCPPSPYRFVFLIQKALETAGEVRNFGAALLAAFEKGDAEFLAAMRSSHERQLLNLTEEIRKMEFREADWQVQALGKSKESARAKRQYYADLIAAGLISGEQAYQNLTGVSMTTRAAGNVVEAVGQVMNLIPDPTTGAAGIASTPVAVFQLPIGTKLAHSFSAGARILYTVADITGTEAGLSLTEAGWDRREADWIFQVTVLDIEIQQIERQILAAERRRDTALRQLNNLVQQKQQAAEVQDFLRDKFTNHALYLFLQQETAALHHQMFDIAWCWARQAQRAFQFEREFTTQTFLPTGKWDNLHEGLMTGEKLSVALRAMEKSYFDQNRREQELTTRLSLRQDFPLAFLELKVTGRCEIKIPEWRFDRDYPGHYLRRIKSVSLTIPCVVGPYTGVHCKLTLLSSCTRINPTLLDIEECCPNQCTCGCCGPQKYESIPDDPRIARRYGATEAIATSTAQNDAGLFELNFRDERYLPFEFSGAVSRWRIELPIENNHFDLDTVSDLMFQLSYTARDGGEMLRTAAWNAASCILPGAGLRHFDWRQDFPDAWHRFQAIPEVLSEERSVRSLALRMSRGMFPYLPGNRPVRMRRIELWFEAPDAESAQSHEIEFVPYRDQKCNKDSEECCERFLLTCIASRDWPCLFHGVLEYPFPYLTGDRPESMGDFLFPCSAGEVYRAYLICSYEAGRPTRCLPKTECGGNKCASD